MEVLGMIAFIGAWVLLGILSNRFGDDSRDRYYDPPTGTLADPSQFDATAPPRSGRNAGIALPGRNALEGIATRRAASVRRAFPEPTRNSLSLL